MQLTNRSAIITGANQGLGLAIAKSFVQSGANVAICGRDQKLLQQARLELEQLAQGNSKVIAEQVDVSCPKQNDDFVTSVMQQFGKIDILVANAGVYGPKGAIEENIWEEWSTAIDINLKGTVLACRSVLPHFKNKKAGKIIILSGGGATKPMPFLSAYAASKAGVVRFAETLAEEVKEFNIDVTSVAPGALNTRLLEEILSAGPEKVGQQFYQQSLKQKQSGGTPLEKAAELCVFLASTASDGISGKLISAVWDPWQDFAKFKNELINSDIYTLRRIVPADRGKDWDVKE